MGVARWALLWAALILLPCMTAFAQDDDGGASQGQYGQRDQGQAACPGAAEVDTLGPTRSDDRSPFETTTDRFRVTYEVDFVNDRNLLNDFTVEITDRFGLVESDFAENDTTESFLVAEEAGSFAVETDVEPENGATYTVTVEECGGAGGGGGDGDGNGDGGDLNCDDFDSQEDAQDVVNDDTDDPNNLDADDDGLACEDFPYGQVMGNGDDDDLPNTGGPTLSVLAALGLFAAVLTLASTLRARG